MKRSELEMKLKGFKWFFLRHNKHHDIWTNGKGDEEYISRTKGKDIPSFVVAKVLKKAKENPGE